MARLRWFFCLVVLEGLLSSSAEVTYPSPFPQEKEAAYWYELGKNDIHEALHRPKNEKVAKNVILFLGDGLGITVGTASRILKGQRQGYSGEEGYLLWERFPNIGLLKTYNLDKQVSDSAGTATAYLTGVKANYRTLGVTGNVPEGDCEGSLKPENRLDSILQWAQDAGKDTGLVTTAQVTHASPAGLYAKSAHRKWQCDSKMAKAGEHTRPCKDIARQLVEDEPGKNMNVIMGGGRQELGAPTLAEARDKCRRADGRDLVDEWLGAKRKQGRTSAYVTSAKQLQDLDVENVDYIMGLFGEIHLPYAVDGVRDAPSLAQMVQAAVRRLSRSKEGFFLMVEGARIDHAMHDGRPRRALEEVLAMEDALQETLDLVDLEDTLIVVTADHSHVMTMNGYPPRGNDIFGLVENNVDVTDDLPYTTLMFTTGHAYNYTWDGEKVMRRNLTGVDTKDKDFEPLAAVPTIFGEETHGGEDVAAFAVGPMAHLFHRTHEQTHVAHVMAYSSCIGPYSPCDRPKQLQHEHGEKEDEDESEHNDGHTLNEEATGDHSGGHGGSTHAGEHDGHNHGMKDSEGEHAEHTGGHGGGHSVPTPTEPVESEHGGKHEHAGEHPETEHIPESLDNDPDDHSEYNPTAEYDHAQDKVIDDHSHHHIVEIVPLEKDKDKQNEHHSKEEEDGEEDEDEEEDEDDSKTKVKAKENEESDEENETEEEKGEKKASEKKEEEEEEEDQEEEVASYIVNKIKAPRGRGAASAIALNYVVVFLLTAFSAIRMVG